MQKCQDGYFTTYGSFAKMLEDHDETAKNSQWVRCKVQDLEVLPLDETSALYGDVTMFAPGTTRVAVDDTAESLGLALRVNGLVYPIRDTAYKSLLDRAKIGGSVLPKLSRRVLSEVLNECLHMFPQDALVLIRDEKVAAVHSGDEVDYSVLPINELLKTLKGKMDERFTGNEFLTGYSDHAISSIVLTMPLQKIDLIGAYAAILEGKGKKTIAEKLLPGIRFNTSDTGVASAKVSALLLGGQYPIHLGGCISVDHRHQAKIEDFGKALDMLFAQFYDNVEKLKNLLDIHLDYPVNAMTRVCKKLCLPKKAAVEAIAMYEMASGGMPATAHDVFMAMQEIMFILKTQNTPESKLLEVEENMARALSINWTDFDLAKGVEY